MRTISKLFAAAALVASTSTFALAQADVGVEVEGDVGVEAGVDAGANANANSNAANANANANANPNAAAGNVNYGQIISSLRTSTIAASDIEALGADAQIEVITLSEVRGDAAENASALDEAVSAQSASLADLTAAIEANAEVAAALEAAGFTADQIVAVSSSGEGQLTIVVDDSM